MEDAEVLSVRLRDHAVPQHRDLTQLAATLEGECRQRHLEPPAPDRIERIVRSALSMYEERFHARTLGRLSPVARALLDALLVPADCDPASSDEKSQPRTIISTLRSDSGRVGVKACAANLKSSRSSATFSCRRNSLQMLLRTISNRFDKGSPLKRRGNYAGIPKRPA